MGAVERRVQAATGTPLSALLGNPNCGKTALFNRLTGARQKVANYAGVTIERKEGSFTSPSGRHYRLLDLPGAYSLAAHTPDEAITRDVVAGLRAGEQAPDAIVCVVNATNLRLNLRLVLEVQRLGLPMVLALNMVDVAHKRGIVIDADGQDWFARIFGRGGFTLLPDPQRLPRALPDIYHGLTRET